MAHHRLSEQRKISDLLTDKNEFPSLTEVSKHNKKRDSVLCDNTIFSYSAKLKISHNPKQNLSNKFSIGKKTFTEFIPGVPILINASEDKSSEKEHLTAKKEETNSTAPSLVELSQSNQKVETSHNAWSRIVSSTSKNSKHPSHQANKNVSSNAKGKSPPNVCKEIPKKNVSAESDAESGVKKKKRKRKSKVKRQAALKSGKISLVTPEIHSKIINQTVYSNDSISISLSSNINDSEEYPELGKAVNVRKIKPEKRSIPSENANIAFLKKEQSENSEHPKQSTVNIENPQDLQTIFLNGTKPIEICKELKSDQKSVVHPNDPITLSFFDILSTSKPKVKEHQEKLEAVIRPVPYKSSIKKVNSQPHNLLASTPVVKRGKEREIPKAKKPSHMKKIILMDRKNRQEQMIQLKNSLNENKPDLPLLIQDNSVAAIMNDANGFSDEESAGIMNSVSPLPDEIIINNEQLAANTKNNSNEIDFKVIEQMSTQENISCEFNSADESNEDTKQSGCPAPPISHNETEKLVKASSSQIADALTLKHIEMLNTMFGLTLSLKDADKNENSCFSDEERLKASKILIHTRNFREYCNHLPSVEIDDAVSAFLSDIVRFQDRMHQKDPVKAHMKRRLICGIKEVKKHLKLRKIKCVLLATDVENVQTEGGLNDALSDLKQAAADHQIPCIFALRKKKMGKLCHKPVPVSCIGIFNYEGTEVNFKKMMELLNQSKEDYEQILKGVMIKLSDDDIKQLFKARLVAPESLMEIRSNILRKTLVENPKIDDMPNIEVVVES